MNLNRCFLIGRLGKTPEVKTTTSGQSVATATLCTSRTWKDKSGQKQEQAEWHNLVFWGKLAEIVSQYCTKGSLLFADGRLQTRKWEKEGVTHYQTEVVVENIQLGPKPAGAAAPAAKPATSETQPIINLEDEEIPPPVDDGSDLPF